jgi:hypothetical protein
MSHIFGKLRQKTLVQTAIAERLEGLRCPIVRETLVAADVEQKHGTAVRHVGRKSVGLYKIKGSCQGLTTAFIILETIGILGTIGI